MGCVSVVYCCVWDMLEFIALCGMCSCCLLQCVGCVSVVYCTVWDVLVLFTAVCRMC